MNALQELARTVMAELEDDDIESAIIAAKTRVLQDDVLQRIILDWAIRALIQSEWRNGRQARWHNTDSELVPVTQPAFGGGTTTPSATLVAGLNHAVNDAKKRLMDWEMSPGRRLGKCAKPEIIDAAIRLEKQAHTETLRAAWYRSIAAMLPDSRQPVEAVLRETDLQRLKRNAARKTEAA